LFEQTLAGQMYYDPQHFHPRNSVGYLMKRAHGLLHDRYEPLLAQHGFTFTQWVVLIWLRENGVLTPGDLCRDLRHDNGALTRVIDQLEARGLVDRSRSRQDRRVVEIDITADGKAVLDALTPLIVEQLNLALSGFDAKEFAELQRLLGKFVAGLESMPAVVPPAEDNP
jgi:DNA-binding MarR family transcriptional regulator